MSVPTIISNRNLITHNQSATLIIYCLLLCNLPRYQQIILLTNQVHWDGPPPGIQQWYPWGPPQTHKQHAYLLHLSCIQEHCSGWIWPIAHPWYPPEFWDAVDTCIYLHGIESTHANRLMHCLNSLPPPVPPTTTLSLSNRPRMDLIFPVSSGDFCQYVSSLSDLYNSIHLIQFQEHIKQGLKSMGNLSTLGWWSYGETYRQLGDLVMDWLLLGHLSFLMLVPLKPASTEHPLGRWELFSEADQ